MDDLIARARKLDTTATSGPWARECTGQGNAVFCLDKNITPPGLRLEDANFIAQSRTLLPALADLAESLIADQKEYNAESIRHHCEWMNKRAEFYAIIERVSKERDAARAEVERLKLEVAALRAERDHLATTRMEASAEIDRLQTERAALAQENARLINEVGELDATVREQRHLAETLARGIQAYRWKSESVAAAWENDNGKMVP